MIKQSPSMSFQFFVKTHLIKSEAILSELIWFLKFLKGIECILVAVVRHQFLVKWLQNQWQIGNSLLVRKLNSTTVFALALQTTAAGLSFIV